MLISPKVVEGITRNGGFLKQGHTFQAHPISCAAALAVQEVVESENLLENIRTQGAHLGELRPRTTRLCCY
jgi:E3 ubiquitin-protein ligase TRIP12